MSLNRRMFLKTSALGAAGTIAAPYGFRRTAKAASPVKVGVLFSLTGGLSIIEKSLHDATMMAITEINGKGGVLGEQIEAVAEDGASDPRTFNEKASKLVIEDRVASVFGCYTSASRKAVLPVFEKRQNLLFYPTYYEGFECSKNVVYTGAVPNQQLSNFIPWIIKHLGKKKFFIVGSNYIYPREMAKVCKILIKENGGEWLADEYLELGDSEWGSMVNKIKNSGCDVVLSNVVGDSVVAFYREYKNQGLTHDKLPICATVTSRSRSPPWALNTPSAALLRSPTSRRSTHRKTTPSSSATRSSSTIRRRSPTTRWSARTSRSTCGSRRWRRPRWRSR